MESSRVIFNADDFGRSPTIDEVVIRALPPTSIPHLVDSSGRFRDEPARAGFLYFFSRTAREELSREIAAQFQMFDTTGLPLSHVDGHLNIHLHPAVLSLAPPLAVKHGARGLRLPRDDIRLSLRLRRGGAAGKVALTLTFAILTRRAAHRLRHLPLATTDRVYGLLESGHMDETYVVRVLEQLSVRTAELYFHPDGDGVAPGGDRERLGPNPGDLATLLSPAVKEAARGRNLRLSTYHSLGEE